MNIKEWLKAKKKDIFYLLIICNIIIWSVAYITTKDFYESIMDLELKTHQAQAKEFEEKFNNEIEEYIIKQARIHGVNERKALSIAYCESRMNPSAKNNHSTATGLFQFLDGTWNSYCEGDRLNYKDNTDCFMQLYNQFPSWWECELYI